MPLTFGLAFFVFLATILGSGRFSEAQAPEPNALCQAQVRLEEDLQRYVKNIAVQLLLRVEKAESQVRELQKQVEELKKAAHEENNGPRP
jgi:TolA-binding protein